MNTPLQTSIDNLVTIIKYHRKLYWDGIPEISDREYDSLIEDLQSIDPNNSILSEIEFKSDSTNKKIQHDTLMLSLEKKYSYEEVVLWIEKVSRSEDEVFLIQPKFDGVASKYYYNKNILATRGNGKFGEDISIKLPLIELKSNIYKTWNDISEDLNGEIIITFTNFKNATYKKKGGGNYKTPRNLAAGILNLKDISPVIGKVQLSFIDYNLLSVEIKKNQLTPDLFNKILLNLKDMDYPTDGIVFKLKDIEYGQSLGNTDHHYKSNIAFKPEDKGTQTELLDIKFQSGKNKITPVAIVQPVMINNVEIKRCSLHNFKFIQDKDIHIGDTLTIIRSNDVIPYVVSVFPGKERKLIELPNCPACGEETYYNEPDIKCSNKECSGNLAKRLLDSIRTLGIEEIGLPTVEKLIDQLGIENILDFLNLTKEDILLIDGFADLSATQLWQQIQNSISTSKYDYEILASLGIPGIGKTIWKVICQKYNIQEIINLKADQLIEIPQIGDSRAEIIIEYLANDSYQVLNELRQIFKIIDYKKEYTIKLKICFSGTFPNPKDYYRKIAKEKGYEVTETINKSVTYLVSAGAQTDKVSKARKLGIQILNVSQFLDL